MAAKARFVDPMLLLKVDSLPGDSRAWSYELKLDGYRAIAFNTGGKIRLRSRNDKDFSKYDVVMRGLAKLPPETVIDGEVVAMDPDGRPSFSLLQNYGSAGVQLLYFVFDVMILRGKDVMHEPLSVRRELLQGLLPKLAEPIRYVPPFDVDLKTMIRSVKEQSFEGVIAKRNDSPYEPGLRSGLWQKMRVNHGQEFVVGGYSKGNPFDALIFGYYEDGELLYAGRTRAGFTPVTRASAFKRFKGLEMAECPFVNLPQKKSGRWGAGLTKEKMPNCVWLQPQLVAQIEFLEWTPDGNLRHTKFVGMRDDKDARGIVRDDREILIGNAIVPMQDERREPASSLRPQFDGTQDRRSAPLVRCR